MQTILLLGGYGFIGTNILKYIDTNNLDYQVIVFDRFPSHHKGVSFKCVYKVYSGDFSDDYLLNSVFNENKVDIVIHSLSASVPSSSMDNLFDIRANVLPTIKLFDIMRANGVEKIIFISSGGAVYGDAPSNSCGHSEMEVLYPKSPYGISKLVIEKYLYMYHHLYGLKSVILRLSNPYGPYHYSMKQGIINIAIEKAIKGDTIQVWGDGNGKKDYIYIDDFNKVLFFMVNHVAGFDIYNLGSGELFSVNEILKSITNYKGTEVNVEYVSGKELDVQSFRLDISKLLSAMPGLSFTDFTEGIAKTYEWHQLNA